MQNYILFLTSLRSSVVLNEDCGDHCPPFLSSAIEEARSRILEACVGLLEAAKSDNSAAIPSLLDIIRTEVGSLVTVESVTSYYRYYLSLHGNNVFFLSCETTLIN